MRLQDSGPGVPPEMREQIFNPFVTTKKTGVGLGLSIVSKIVDEHQGTIRLENPDGKGARFVIFFPAGPASETWFSESDLGREPYVIFFLADCKGTSRSNCNLLKSRVLKFEGPRENHEKSGNHERSRVG